MRHLAQLKYIVPEVIVAKKILVQDEKTKCMEEELLVSLDMGAVENDANAKGGDGFAKLKKMFRSRVTDYSKTHLEVLIMLLLYSRLCSCFSVLSLNELIN